MNLYYYIKEDGQQSGPISVENFKKNGITVNTSVWCEGMKQWTKAGDIPELKSLFTQVPPPFPPAPNSQIYSGEQCPEDYMLFSILTTLLCCLPLGIVAIIYSNKVKNAWSSGNKSEAQKYSEQAKMLCMVSAGCGIVSFIFYFIVGFMSSL